MRVKTWRGIIPSLALLASLAAVRAAKAQDPSEFLKRLDTNGNGMIDPSEAEGRFGGFLQRMAENNPRMDLSRPVPISQLSDEFTRMREQRMSGGGGPPFGGPGGGPPGGFQGGRGGPAGGGRGGPERGGPDRGGQERGGPDRGGRPDDAANPYRATTTKIEPLVPGFGVEELLTPPPGFGAEGELFAVDVTEQDRQEAERTFRYYDSDRNGKVDAEEMRRSRYGADLALYDRNRDGVITLNEMEYRYARRRVENTRAGGGAAVANQGGQRGRGRPDQGGGQRGQEDSNAAQASNRFGDRNSYRVVPALERLPEGLPEWFPRNDADGDGQIMMSEFSATWTDLVLADFNQFDLNQDGLITPQECLKAQENGAMRGAAVAVASPTPASPSAAIPSGPSAPVAAGGPAAAVPVTLAGIEPKYVDYYRKLVAKYDANGDAALTADEWVKMSKNPEAADADGDQRITVEEFARWQLQR